MKLAHNIYTERRRRRWWWIDDDSPHKRFELSFLIAINCSVIIFITPFHHIHLSWSVTDANTCIIGCYQLIFSLSRSRCSMHCRRDGDEGQAERMAICKSWRCLNFPACRRWSGFGTHKKTENVIMSTGTSKETTDDAKCVTEILAGLK